MRRKHNTFTNSAFSQKTSATVDTTQLNQAVSAYINNSTTIAKKTDIEDLQTKIDNLEIPSGDSEYVILGKNKFNPDTVTTGKYISESNGNLATNSNYNASDYIDVSSSEKWTRSKAYRLAWYDANKTFISGLNTQTLTVTRPTNAKYVRLSLTVADMSSFQFEAGETKTEYEKYGYKLRDDVSVKVASEFELLPIPNIKVARGRTIEIYNRHVCRCGNIYNYHFEWLCNKGKNMNRKFQFYADANGTYTVTLNVYDNFMNVIATRTFTITVSDVNSTDTRVLVIGDSLSSDKPWYTELKTLNSHLTFVGTQGKQIEGVKHEGRSGYTSGKYIQDSSFTYIGNYKIKVGALTTQPTTKKQYTVPTAEGTSKFEVEEVVVEDGATWIYMNRLTGAGAVTSSGTMTAVDTGVTGDNTIAYTNATCTSKNPFWNPTTSKVDFAYYVTSTEIAKPDKLVIFLGTNDMGTSGSETAFNIRTLVNACNTDWNIPIEIVLPPYYANQDGHGITSGASKTQMKYDRIMYDKHKAIIDLLSTTTNVSIVPVGLCHDSDYNFGLVDTNVNPRNTFKVKMPQQSTHPQECGYLQFADVLLGYL